jgi:hypothetical protein
MLQLLQLSAILADARTEVIVSLASAIALVMLLHFALAATMFVIVKAATMAATVKMVCTPLSPS